MTAAFVKAVCSIGVDSQQLHTAQETNLAQNYWCQEVVVYDQTCRRPGFWQKVKGLIINISMANPFEAKGDIEDLTR